MYVALYNDSVHPGVRMLLGMGALAESNDLGEIDEAGRRIQLWARGARERIVELLVQVSPAETRLDTETHDLIHDKFTADEGERADY